MCPNPCVVRIGPPLSEPTVIIELADFDSLASAELEAPANRVVTLAPASDPVRLRAGRPRRRVVVWNPLHRRAPNTGMRRRVTAVQMRQDIRIPKERGAVDKHDATRMLSHLEPGALELDQSLKRGEGKVHLRMKLRVPAASTVERGVDPEIHDENISYTDQVVNRGHVLEVGNR